MIRCLGDQWNGMEIIFMITRMIQITSFLISYFQLPSEFHQFFVLLKCDSSKIVPSRSKSKTKQTSPK